MKKLISLLLVCSMLLPMTLITSSAVDTVSTATNPTIDISGDVYTELINAGLVDPNFVTSTNGESELTPPPELIIGEGEVWIPGAIDPNLISLYGEDDECRHRGEPSNYRFIGAVQGNTIADAVAVDVFTGIISVFIPAPFGWAFDLISAISSIFPGDKLEGDYVKYQYIYNFGPDPNMYWFHTSFVFKDDNGNHIGGDCYATYSPKKPGDKFQD